MLFSRHGPFDVALLEDLAYGDRELFEYWAHEASLVLTEDLPLHRWEMSTWPRGNSAWHRRLQEWWDVNPDFRAHIFDRLRTDGPLRARDIEDRSVKPWFSTGWTHERNVSRMLDLMWVRGHVGIAARDGGQRLWDLMERCLPPDAPAGAPGDAEVTRRAALLALRALGVARAPHIRAHFTRGRYPGLAEQLAALEHEGRIVPVDVDGLRGPWWTRAEDVETLEKLAAGDGAWRGRTALLSPFDNVLCDRARTEELFGFSHRLEIYTPKAKRRWGYFVLPVLHGDRLIGRLDLAIDRRAGRLVAHAVHREPDAPAREGGRPRDPARARAPRRVAGRRRRRAAERAGCVAGGAPLVAARQGARRVKRALRGLTPLPLKRRPAAEKPGPAAQGGSDPLRP